MNPKTIVKYILIALGIYIFVWIPLDTFVINPAKKTIRYEVVEKRTGPYTESTGKHSSRTSDATFIRIRDENGSYETLTITDPYISDTYVVGNTYVKEFDRIGPNGFSIPFQFLLFLIFIIYIVVGIILFCVSCVVLFATIEWSCSDKYDTWTKCFKSYFPS